jgi:uridine phosphorylase
MQHAYPILEFDHSRETALDPQKILPPLATMPTKVVLCFFYEVLQTVCATLPILTELRSEIGKNPVYALEYAGQRIAITHPGVGAPLAAGFLEELIALGGRQFVACGGAGVLDSTIAAGHVVIPTAAVRDEGTSYHYLPPAREVAMLPAMIAALRQVLVKHGIPHDLGKTWTTDAIYRETRAKVAHRRAEGCLTVEMETAAFLAVAQFRHVQFGQYLYGGDDVSGSEWDSRGWHQNASTREKLFWLAVEALASLSENAEDE